MDILVQIVVFACAAAIVWFFAGIILESVSSLAVRFKKTGFVTAFFILGFLTSIGEISVAINAGLAGEPGVSVGNLAGATFVLLLLIIPLLAIAGNGIRLSGAISSRNLLFMLGLALLPLLLVLDGNVTRTEGLLTILAYGTVAFALFRTRAKESFAVDAGEVGKTRSIALELARVAVSGAAIFFASRFLVQQAVYFADVLHAPASLMGLVLLSIGTNLPEIVIAVRSVLKNRSDLAFGNYLGSASMNSLTFGVLAATTGTFAITASQFAVTALLMAAGFVLLFIFAKSHGELSRKEGVVLALFYIVFIVFQIISIAQFATS